MLAIVSSRRSKTSWAPFDGPLKALAYCIGFVFKKKNCFDRASMFSVVSIAIWLVQPVDESSGSLQESRVESAQRVRNQRRDLVWQVSRDRPFYTLSRDCEQPNTNRGHPHRFFFRIRKFSQISAESRRFWRFLISSFHMLQNFCWISACFSILFWNDRESPKRSRFNSLQV